MNNIQPGGSTQSPLQTVRILWGAFFASQFTFLFVFLNTAREGEAPTPADPAFAIALAAAVPMLLGLAWFLPRRIGQGELAALQRRSPSPTPDEIVTAATSPFILRLAFLEAVTILGLVLAFQSRDIRYFYPFLAVATVGFLCNTPTKERFENLLRA